MAIDQTLDQLAQSYLRFAQFEAAGRSQIYHDFALHVAQSKVAQQFLMSLPLARRQPNLFFAAIRMVRGLPNAPSEIDDLVLSHGDAISQIMRTHTTQTNEAARCAVLLPLIAQIKGPIALLEVGASAGLCLLMDHYAYDWGIGTLTPCTQTDIAPPCFKCKASANMPVPTKMPEIVWRAGIDLNPLSLANQPDMNWLETLIWPEHVERRENLQKAIAVAKQSPPKIYQADLNVGLQQIIDQAPSDATLVVFHSAVLAYVSDPEAREAFAMSMLNGGHVWLSNEGAKVFPKFSENIEPQPGKFLLARNGVPLAWTGPHGQSIDWIG